MKMKLTVNYYIDSYNVLHTYIGDKKHVTISNVTSDEEAERLLSEMNKELIKENAKEDKTDEVI